MSEHLDDRRNPEAATLGFCQPGVLLDASLKDHTASRYAKADVKCPDACYRHRCYSQGHCKASWQ